MKDRDWLDPLQLHDDAKHLRRYMLLLLGAAFLSPLAEVYVAFRMMRGVWSRSLLGVILIPALMVATSFCSYLTLMHLGGLFHYDMFAPGWFSEAWAITRYYPSFHAHFFTEHLFDYVVGVFGSFQLVVWLTQPSITTEIPVHA